MFSEVCFGELNYVNFLPGMIKKKKKKFANTRSNPLYPMTVACSTE